MKIEHHLSEELLLDYATGALGEGWSIPVATHLALCPGCRRQLSAMEAVGGGLLESLSPAAVSGGTLEAVMARLDAEETAEQSERPPVSRDQVRRPVLPEPLRSYAGGDAAALKWQRLGPIAHQLLIPTSDEGTAVRLLKIPAGKPVPEHSHCGMELTLVLAGSFSDVTGIYHRGDIQQADEALKHQPHAGPEEDCICLAVTDAPLRFSSLSARLVQPFLKI